MVEYNTNDAGKRYAKKVKRVKSRAEHKYPQQKYPGPKIS